MYERLEYELEFITPAFIGGAFPQEEAELRPASLIGLLRWWFRNLALTVTSDIDAIYNLESELFGNNKKAGKLKIQLKTRNTFIYPYQIIDDNYRNQSILYIGFGNFMYLTRNNIDRYPYILNFFRKSRQTLVPPGVYNIRSFITTNKRFEIIFLVPKNYSIFIKTLMSILDISGTAGSRRRRGWSSLKVVKGEKYLFHKIYPTFSKTLEKFLKKYVEHNALLKSLQGILITIFPKKLFEKDSELFSELAKSYRAYRRQFPPNKRKFLGSANPRRASSFIFKVTPTPRGYFLTVTHILNGIYFLTAEDPNIKPSEEFCKVNLELLKFLSRTFGEFTSVFLKAGKVSFFNIRNLDNLKEECLWIGS